VVVATSVVMAMPLYSTKKSTGTLHNAAKVMASYSAPSPNVPSPTCATAIASVPLSFRAQPRPTANGGVPPCTPLLM